MELENMAMTRTGDFFCFATKKVWLHVKIDMFGFTSKDFYEIYQFLLTVSDNQIQKYKFKFSLFYELEQMLQLTSLISLFV